MIYSLTGKILKKTLDTVVISCAGVGYAVQVPLTTAESLPAPGREGTVYTVMNVTENDVSLYGFATEEQQSCFELLTAVSGVGPKVGLAILSVMEPDRVALAISAGDHKAFKAASGVGPKLAQRIVLRGQKPLALCDRCPCFGSLFPPLAALTFAASSIICAFGLAAAAPRSPYRHLELCGIALRLCQSFQAQPPQTAVYHQPRNQAH